MIEALKKYNFWDAAVKGTGITRPIYLDQLARLNTGKTIVTVTGLRRVGKSFIVRQFMDHLIRQMKVPPCQIFYANLFLRELGFLRDPDRFQEAVTSWQKNLNVDTGQRMYLFIDEVQEIKDWEKLAGSFFEDYTAEYKIIITGSNSKLLSGELATYLAGRSHELRVFPLSFNEFCTFTEQDGTRENLLTYLTHGGMPEIVLADNHFARNNLIETTIDSVIMRDIVARYEIRNVRLLKKIVEYVSASASDEVSRNRMAHLIDESGKRASVHTVSDYLECLKEAFFIHECPVFSHKKNDYLKSGPRKIYLNDLVFMKKDQRFGGYGKQLENLVYMALKRKGFTISTVRTGKGEVDFLSQKNGDRAYYQVEWTINDPGSETYGREFESLLSIQDHYPKHIITMDDLPLPPRKGIRHIPALDFFSSDN